MRLRVSQRYGPGIARLAEAVRTRVLKKQSADPDATGRTWIFKNDPAHEWMLG